MSWLYVPPEYCQSAPGPALLTSESILPEKILEQSVTLNGKHSRSRTWLQRSRRDFWIQRLYGAICEPSIAAPGVARWIGSLGESHANPIPTLEAERERQTTGTSGPILQGSLENSNPNLSSWKTFQESLGITTSPLGQSYEAWVTKLRKDYSRRQKLVRPISDNDFLSWPTPTTAPEAPNKGSHVKDGGFRNLIEASAGLWRTPEGTDAEGGVMELREGTNAHLKLRDQTANWQTPVASEGKTGGPRREGGAPLAYQVRTWPTPMASDSEKRGAGEHSRPRSRLAYVANRFPTPAARDYKDWDGPNKASGSKDYQTYSPWPN